MKNNEGESTGGVTGWGSGWSGPEIWGSAASSRGKVGGLGSHHHLQRHPQPLPSLLSPGRPHREDTWTDGGRNSRVTGIYHVNGRGGGAGKGGARNGG